MLSIAAVLGAGLTPLSATLAAPCPANVCSRNALSAAVSSPSNCNNCRRKSIFWVPGCPSPPGSTTPLTTNAFRMGASGAITVLFNRAPSRRLSLRGTSGADIMVGSPGSSDTLTGLLGNNTFVVGNVDSTLLADAVSHRDRVFPESALMAAVLSATAEIDQLILEDGATDYVHLKNQGSPGTITTPTGDRAVPGSDALAPATKVLCPPAPPMRARSSLSSPAAADSGAGQRWRADFPGAPVLQGFDLRPTSPDRLFLSAEGLTFQGKPIHKLFPPGEPIPVLLAPEVRFAPSRLVRPEELERLRKRATGLTSVASDLAPLVYFPQNGLLVLSRNGEPLGSSANPGRVIARLLDREGQPAVFPCAAPQPSCGVRFLTFTLPAEEGSGASKR